MFSLRSLLVTIAFLAVSCASLAYPSSGWQLLLRSMFGVCCLVSALVILYRRDEQRAFSVGFLLFGVVCGVVMWRTGYFNMRTVVGLGDPVTMGDVEALRARARLYNPSSNRFKQTQQELRTLEQRADRVRIAKDLAVWILAVLGGCIATYLRRTADRIPESLAILQHGSPK